MHGKQCQIALSSKSCSHSTVSNALSCPALPCCAAAPTKVSKLAFRSGRAALGYFIAAVSPNMDVANAALPAYVTVLLFFVGLLLRPQDQPRYWHWFSYLDFLKYAWSAQMINQFESSHAIALDFQTVRAPELNTNPTLHTTAEQPAWPALSATGTPGFHGHVHVLYIPHQPRECYAQDNMRVCMPDLGVHAYDVTGERLHNGGGWMLQKSKRPRDVPA